jgi:hypothetical protein
MGMDCESAWQLVWTIKAGGFLASSFLCSDKADGQVAAN